MYKRMHPLPIEAVVYPERFADGQVLDYAADLVVKAFSGTYNQPSTDDAPRMPSGVVYLQKASDTNYLFDGVKTRRVVVPLNIDPQYLGNPWAKTIEEVEP